MENKLTLYSEVESILTKGPDPEEFALWIAPQLESAIETANTAKEVNDLRGIADMAKAYLRQALPVVIKERKERLKKMYPVEEAYVKACGKAGLLIEPLRSGQGSRTDLGKIPQVDGGFQNRRDITMCVRIGQLIKDDELKTYFEYTKGNGAHITVGGAENVWRMFYGSTGDKGKGILLENEEIKFGYWALPRPLTSGWGSGKVWQRLCQEFAVPDVAFGIRDNIPSKIIGVDLTTGFDWNKLPFENNQFIFGYWDPPYDHLYKNEGIEIWRTCRRLAILHTHIWPRAWLKKAKRQAMIAITMGPMKQIRCLQIFEKANEN